MSENKSPGYAPENYNDHLHLIIAACEEIAHSRHGLDHAIDRIKKYAEEGLEAKPAGAVWVKAADRLPDVFNGKCHPRFVRIERKGHSGKVFVVKAVAYYFPEHFKSVEWEDWDDYSEEDFPYTESDEEKGVVWLKPGWYADIECDACDNSHWSAPLNVIEWLDESGAGGNDAIEFAEWIKAEGWNQRASIDWAKYETIYSDVSVKTTADLHQLWQQSKINNGN